MKMNDLLMKLTTKRDRRGSKPRCHLLAHGDKVQVAARLAALCEGHGVVSAQDYWMPDGFINIEEAQLGQTHGFLNDEQRAKVTKWWLAVSKNANTPNWDVASTCKINGIGGLMLIEAKAHHKELIEAKAGKRKPRATDSKNSFDNHKHIAKAINEAGRGLSNETRLEWKISRDSHYQMSNRFAWAWKLTELGFPVILVYLGFLEAEDLKQGEKPIVNSDEWEQLVKGHSASLFPGEVWNKQWTINGQAFIPLIRSVKLKLEVKP